MYWPFVFLSIQTRGLTHKPQENLQIKKKHWPNLWPSVLTLHLWPPQKHSTHQRLTPACVRHLTPDPMTPSVNNQLTHETSCFWSRYVYESLTFDTNNHDVLAVSLEDLQTKKQKQGFVHVTSSRSRRWLLTSDKSALNWRVVWTRFEAWQLQRWNCGKQDRTDSKED